MTCVTRLSAVQIGRDTATGTGRGIEWREVAIGADLYGGRQSGSRCPWSAERWCAVDCCSRGNRGLSHIVSSCNRNSSCRSGGQNRQRCLKLHRHRPLRFLARIQRLHIVKTLQSTFCRAFWEVMHIIVVRGDIDQPFAFDTCHRSDVVP